MEKQIKMKGQKIHNKQMILTSAAPVDIIPRQIYLLRRRVQSTPREREVHHTLS